VDFFSYFAVTFKLKNMRLNLGLLFGGRSGEHEVSLQSARSIAAAVDRNKYTLFLIAIDKSGEWYLAPEEGYLLNPDSPANIELNTDVLMQIALIPAAGSNKMIRLEDGSEIGSLDVVFPVIHGNFGEDGALQGYLSMLNIPCVGADILGSAIGMDKYVAKQLLKQAGIPVADYLMADKGSDIETIAYEAETKFGYPVFVKPSCSGSSVGVYRAEKREEVFAAIRKALAFDRRVLIEEAISGREIECAVLGNVRLKASIPGEIIPKHAFYSYEAKYLDAQGAQLDFPAKLTTDEVERVQATALKAYKALSCSGMARVDMFLAKKGSLILNEINTLPGFTKISMYPKLMELSGLSFSGLIDQLVELAIERHKEQSVFLQNILAQSAY
jgi:D-alanine-D-alanine ligase